MNFFLKPAVLFSALVIPAFSSAAPYCADLTDPDALPSKYQKRAPFYSDTTSGWIIGNDQLKGDFAVSSEASALLRHIVAEFESRGIELAVLAAPPRPLFAPTDARTAAGVPTDFEAGALQDGFSAYIGALNAIGISAPDLSSLAEGDSADAYYFKRDTHWTPFGAATSAALLAEALDGGPASTSLSDVAFSSEYSEKGSLSAVVEKVCGARPAVETMVAAEFAQPGSAASLLSDAPAGSSYALVGTSFSDRYQRDAYRVADALAHVLQAPVENYSVTGGGMAGAMEAFIRSGALASGAYKAVVWESPYTAPLNDVSQLRQILGALQSTRTADRSEIFAGAVGDDWVQVKHKLAVSDVAGLEIQIADVSAGILYVELYDKDDHKTRIKLVKSDRIDASDRTDLWTFALTDLPTTDVVRLKVRLPGNASKKAAQIRSFN